MVHQSRKSGTSGFRGRSHLRKQTYHRGRSQSRNRSPSVQRNHRSSTTQQKSLQKICRRCGKSGASHTYSNCPAKNWKCYTCNKMGHRSTVCTKRSSESCKVIQENVNHISVKSRLGKRKEDVFHKPCSAENCTIKVDDKEIILEVDTGSPSTIFSS